MESTGPEGKIRGTAQQLMDKYQTLGKEALREKDTALAQNCFQHADHYSRLIQRSQKNSTDHQRSQGSQNQRNQGQNPHHQQYQGQHQGRHHQNNTYNSSNQGQGYQHQRPYHNQGQHQGYGQNSGGDSQEPNSQNPNNGTPGGNPSHYRQGFSRRYEPNGQQRFHQRNYYQNQGNSSSHGQPNNNISAENSTTQSPETSQQKREDYSQRRPSGSHQRPYVSQGRPNDHLKNPSKDMPSLDNQQPSFPREEKTQPIPRENNHQETSSWALPPLQESTFLEKVSDHPKKNLEPLAPKPQVSEDHNHSLAHDVSKTPKRRRVLKKNHEDPSQDEENIQE